MPARVLSLLPPSFARLELKPNIQPLADDVVGNIRETLWLLLAAVYVVLLIACGNVANLFLVRAEARQQELAMRTALGASRARIVRALLSESIILALGGGALGLVFAQISMVLLRWLAPASLPRLDEIGIDFTVIRVHRDHFRLERGDIRLLRAAKVRTRRHLGAQGRRAIRE